MRQQPEWSDPRTEIRMGPIVDNRPANFGRPITVAVKLGMTVIHSVSVQVFSVTWKPRLSVARLPTFDRRICARKILPTRQPIRQYDSTMHRDADGSSATVAGTTRAARSTHRTSVISAATARSSLGRILSSNRLPDWTRSLVTVRRP